MAVRDADAPLTVTFRIGNQEYSASMRRGQIVQEAFRAATGIGRRSPTDLPHSGR